IGGTAAMAVRLVEVQPDAGHPHTADGRGIDDLASRFSASTMTLAEASAQLAAQSAQIGDGVDEAYRSAGLAQETARGAAGVISSSSAAVADIGRSTESIARTV